MFTLTLSFSNPIVKVCEDADILIHVVDSASPIGRQQAWSVQQILATLGAGDESVGRRVPQVPIDIDLDSYSYVADGLLP